MFATCVAHALDVQTQLGETSEPMLEINCIYANRLVAFNKLMCKHVYVDWFGDVCCFCLNVCFGTHDCVTCIYRFHFSKTHETHENMQNSDNV